MQRPERGESDPDRQTAGHIALAHKRLAEARSRPECERARRLFLRYDILTQPHLAGGKIRALLKEPGLAELLEPLPKTRIDPAQLTHLRVHLFDLVVERARSFRGLGSGSAPQDMWELAGYPGTFEEALISLADYQIEIYEAIYPIVDGRLPALPHGLAAALTAWANGDLKYSEPAGESLFNAEPDSANFLCLPEFAYHAAQTPCRRPDLWAELAHHMVPLVEVFARRYGPPVGRRDTAAYAYDGMRHMHTRSLGSEELDELFAFYDERFSDPVDRERRFAENIFVMLRDNPFLQS